MEIAQVRGIVTGAARGLGRCFALQLLRSGAQVMAGDINAAGLRSLMAEAEAHPGRLIAARLDVADESSVTAFVERAIGELDGLNVLVNNAGILRDGLLVDTYEGEVKKLPLAQWRKVLDVNLTGQFLMAREVASHWVRRGENEEAVIVNISSLARGGNPGQSNYAASKAGLDADTRTWALELGRHGIRVGGVAPGVIDTPILEGISEARLDELRAGIPVGRFGTPEEVWLAVRFILENAFFSGRVIEIDGGASLG